MLKIRNIAIIAHVDHGKTTIVDKMLHAAKLFAEHQTVGELILDNNDLERERGITILAKNVSVTWRGFKINIIDTPGHSDFGGEVERVLNMCDGVLLIVDAFEGPMPQTRFVLQKALELGLKPIVVINKVDKLNCDPDKTHEEVFDLMCALDATEEQLDFPVVYGSAKQNWMAADWKQPAQDIAYLLDTIIEHIPAPEVIEGIPQLLITSMEYSKYVGRIAVGRVHRGEFKVGQQVTLCKRNDVFVKTKIKELYVFEGLGKAKIESVKSGEICAMVGFEGFDIGDTVSDIDNPEALPTIEVDEPTMSMLFTINNSPFFGKEGKYVTSRHVKERLERELEKNLALRVEPGDSADSWKVFGRGVLHLSVLIETMRREGYELQVGQPQVIIKEVDGERCEPIETLTIDVPEEMSGKAIDIALTKKAEMISMEGRNGRMQLAFTIPSRGTIGLRSSLLTATQGEAIMSHRFLEYQPWKGTIETRTNGSLIVQETGTSIAFAMDKLQARGVFFIPPGDDVYQGQIIGENSKDNDLSVNVTKKKQLTNMRASGSDDKVKLAPPVLFSLEEALEYIEEDEYVEVTPKSIRLRKILLTSHERKKLAKQQNAE
ncbi:MAG: translational GTPase TypA [Ignavibacteria bacterium]|jgi:GTP-binding protein|nr:translational GTPase TypA [Ignavibacteria bacterium]